MLRMTFLPILLSFAQVFALPAAEPIPDPCTITHTTYTAKYDDLAYVEGALNPIPPHYYGLSYTIFQVDQYDIAIIPASGNQFTTAFGGSGNISIPDSPPNQTFSLEAFYFACISGVPQPECAISIWGWKGGAVAVNRTLKFPRLDSGHESKDFIMNFTRFDRRWRDLTSLGFSIARADNGESMYGGLMLDNVKYTINSGCA